jgi:hypothetical protein
VTILLPDVATADRRPPSADEVAAWSRWKFAAGSLGLAAVDFERNGYTATWHPDDAVAFHTSRELAGAWELIVDDPALAARWAALETLPPGALGRRVTEFDRARGFAYPGLPGSAPPLLAQHDWAHVLADFGKAPGPSPGRRRLRVATPAQRFRFCSLIHLLDVFDITIGGGLSQRSGGRRGAHSRHRSGAAGGAPIRRIGAVRPAGRPFAAVVRCGRRVACSPQWSGAVRLAAAPRRRRRPMSRPPRRPGRRLCFPPLTSSKLEVLAS